MELENVLHMNAGNGETSYANNSIPQKTVIQKSKPVLDDTLKDMYNNEAFPTDCLRIADLGCSSGPNTLLVVSEILDTIHDLCRQNNHKTPEFQVFISDLPQTDFNSVFRSLPTFFEKLKKDKGDNFGACFISAVPGSFYGRLFPCKSLHLVHSSCSVQWLSQVPERLENNMGNIYISKASPSNVFEAYLNQFQKDFSTFLRLRSEELITPNGHMVLTIAGRSAADPTVKDCCCLWELLAISLRQLAAQGVVEEAKVDSFNIPLYTPYKDEVEAIVEKEGSFNLDKLQVFEGNADPAGDHDGDHEKYQESGKYIANGYRAITESLLANHFGDSIIHDLFASNQKSRVASKEAMVVENVLHMNAGNGETSYANNSIIQKVVILKTQSLLENTLKDIYNENLPECFNIADLGCSSGPNTLLVISNIIDVVHGFCHQNNRKPPEFQVFLNDLPDNDFNSIFKSLPTLYAKIRKEKGDKLGPCFISGVPGSFYGRLFPSKSLHFVHSSFSLHWLSQAPGGLENNKRNIYMSKTSPPNVFEAYFKQFQTDFSTFLSLRSEEIVPSGRMVLTILSRSIANPTCKDCCWYWEMLADSLLDMVAEGLVDVANVDSFNLPFYTPYKDEVKDIIQKEGSFDIDRLEVIEDSNEDTKDQDGDEHFVFKKSCCEIGQFTSNCIRAVTEPMLASHFGDSKIDDLFARYAKNVTDQPSVEKIKYFTVVVSLRKK